MNCSSPHLDYGDNSSLDLQALIFWLFFNLFIFQKTIENYVSTASLIDEIVLIYVFFLYFFKGIRKVKKSITIYFILFLSISIFSNMTNGLARGIVPLTIDFLTSIKAYLFFVSLMGVDKRVYIKVKNILIRTWLFIIPTIFFIGIINPFFNVFPSFDQRVGIPSYHFMLDNPGWYANVIICLLGIYYSSSYSAKYIYIMMLVISGYLSLRGKAVVAVSALVVLATGVRYKTKIKVNRFKGYLEQIIRPKKTYAFTALLILFFMGLPQALHYFGGEVTPRYLLVVTAIDIANDHFPFGAGLSTYGSPAAKIFYSPLYEEYGFSKIHGLSESNSQYLNDNFWPTIIGQSGYFGTIFYFLFFYLMLKELIKLCHHNKYKLIATYLVGISLVLSTFGASLFSSTLGMLHILTVFVISGRSSHE